MRPISALHTVDNTRHISDTAKEPKLIKSETGHERKLSQREQRRLCAFLKETELNGTTPHIRRVKTPKVEGGAPQLDFKLKHWTAVA
jgi:hypothetical protein